MKNPKYLPEGTDSLKVAGVDGCKNGWVMVRPDGNGSYRWKARQCFEELMREENDLELVLVDMPIGLSSGAQGNPFFRKVDEQLKSMLGNRSSSVFNAPCREAVQLTRADDFDDNREAYFKQAKGLNQSVDHRDRSLSKQSLNLMKKMDQLDRYMEQKIQEGKKKPYVLESHPELCFERLKEEDASLPSKKEFHGIWERLKLADISRLDQVRPMEQAKGHSDIEIGTDDLVDALGLCYVAQKGVQKQDGLEAILNDPEVEANNYDRKGIRIELLFPSSS